MKLLVVLLSLSFINITNAAVLGSATVVRNIEHVQIKLVSDPIQVSANLGSVIINNPQLEITTPDGQITVVGVAGYGICSLFGFKKESQWEAPYTYSDELTEYGILANGIVTQLLPDRRLKSIKKARCGRI